MKLCPKASSVCKFRVSCSNSFNTKSLFFAISDESEYPVKEFMEENYRPGFKYADFASMFTAKFFDARKWAKIIAKSNAK